LGPWKVRDPWCNIPNTTEKPNFAVRSSVRRNVFSRAHGKMPLCRVFFFYGLYAREITFVVHHFFTHGKLADRYHPLLPLPTYFFRTFCRA
jgi:hypothetical protein